MWSERYGFWVNVFINFAMLVFTAFLFLQTKLALQTAKNANIITDSARISNDSTSNRSLRLAQEMFADQIKSSRIKDSTDSVNLNLTSRFLETQINSFRENQKQFLKQNESYLQITDLEINPFKVDSPLFVKYKLENFGRNPAKILDFKFGIIYKFLQIPIKEIEKMLIKSTPNSSFTYINSNKSIEFNDVSIFEDNVPLSISTYNELIAGKKNIFFFGKITYQNLVTQKKWIYTFLIKVSLRINFGIVENVQYLFTENKEFKNKKEF